MEPKKPFERIVREHGPTVLRVCRAVVGPDDADDAWSETFLSALRAYPELPPTANVEAWLITIAHRKSIDIIRGRNRRPVAVAELPPSESRLGVPGDRQADLIAAIRNLPERQRQAVAYHHLAGLPYRDVAELLGGTAEAARRAASDGVRNLRAQLTVSAEPVKGQRHD
ncbi:RNA polymerase sigma factor [Arthrobacter sp. M4]|uniref:RNA polymerase sigma factor n=1 Tax=Arthrobacter sp. M4 TaxID=218160 RepID=UPI001CDB5249|nr:RNA polymerase sigma factor [Arthrobacter sp. M4]MCA4133216.1 RNA polymerase sigma factor [Arthrobacter sp. M4]